MTTEIVHGPPGSYKTSSLVSLYLLEALKTDRTIVTNIRGFSDIDHLNDVYNLESASKIITVPHDQEGFEKMARFYHWVPKKAFILMDEGQRVYPSRLSKLSEFDLHHHDDPEWPKSVEEAFDKHRHFGWDIYISTTNVAKIHKEIRQVCEFAYRHKNLTSVIPFLGHSFKRVQHDPENNGKTLSNVISSSVKRIDKRAFDVYQSTTTGSADQAKSSNPFLANPKLLIFIGVILFFGVRTFNNFILGDGLSAASKVDNIIEDISISNQGDTVSNSNFSRRNVFHGVDLQDISLKVMQSIKYHSGSTVYSNGSRYQFINNFHSDEYGQISTYHLKYFGIQLKQISNMYLLTYKDVPHLVPSFNPNPDYYHPDNDQNVAVVEGEGAIAERAGDIGLF